MLTLISITFSALIWWKDTSQLVCKVFNTSYASRVRLNSRLYACGHKLPLADLRHRFFSKQIVFVWNDQSQLCFNYFSHRGFHEKFLDGNNKNKKQVAKVYYNLIEIYAVFLLEKCWWRNSGTDSGLALLQLVKAHISIYLNEKNPMKSASKCSIVRERQVTEKAYLIFLRILKLKAL